MNHKISELQARYNLSSKQSVYDRMNALLIIPEKRGEISSDSLDKLDKLNEFLKNNPGAAIWEFPKETKTLSSSTLDKSTRQLDNSTGQLDNFNETLQLVEAIARHFAKKETPDPLENYKALEYAVIHQILLPSSKVKSLTGVKPQKSRLKWGNFVFTKTNKKAGRENTWWVQMTIMCGG